MRLFLLISLELTNRLVGTSMIVYINHKWYFTTSGILPQVVFKNKLSIDMIRYVRFISSWL